MLEKVKSFFLGNQNTRQIFAKNVFWLSSSFVLGRLIKAILIVAIARVLGAEQYGVFSYALGLAAFFTLFADIGITPILTRETARHPDRQQEYLSTSFFIKAVLLAITIVLIMFVAPHFTRIDAAKPLIPIMALLLASDSLQGFIFAITRAHNRMEVEGSFTVLTNLYIVLLSLGVLFIAPGARSLALSYTFGSILGSLTLFLFMRRSLKGILTHFKKPLVKDIILSGWSFSLVGLLGSIMLNTDMLMLGWYRSATELGLYSAAQRPIQVMAVMPGVFAASLFPTMARLANEGARERLRTILERVTNVTIMTALPLCVGGVLLARPLMQLVFGAEYGGAAASFAILLGTILVSFPGVLLSDLLFAYERQKLFIVSASIGVVSNIVFNLLFIPRWGIAGSSASTLITQVLINGYIWWQAKKVQDFALLPHLKKIILATAVMAAATIGLSVAGLNVALNILVSGAVYVGVLLLLNEPLLRDALRLRALFREG